MPRRTVLERLLTTEQVFKTLFVARTYPSDIVPERKLVCRQEEPRASMSTLRKPMWTSEERGARKEEIHHIKCPDPPPGSATGHTGFDAAIGQWGVSDRNLACTVLTRHKTLSDRNYSLRVRVCLLP